MYRLFEVGKDYEGPIYTCAFIENKDVFGLTVNLNVFNLTDGARTRSTARVYDGYRDTAPVLFVETPQPQRRADLSSSGSRARSSAAFALAAREAARSMAG